MLMEGYRRVIHIPTNDTKIVEATIAIETSMVRKKTLLFF
jgi:hypothetical protein